MKDIDFDELDKAVSSLMGSVKDKSEQSSPKTLNISTTLKEDELPEYNNIRQAAEKIGSETITPVSERTQVLDEIADDEVKILALSGNHKTPQPKEATAVAAPVVSESAMKTPAPTFSPAPSFVSTKAPSGRFMDVMHPSSDMKTVNTTSKIPVPVATPSRVARTIDRPVQPAAVPATVQVAPVAMPPEIPVVPFAEKTQPQVQEKSISEEPTFSSMFIPTGPEVSPQTSPFLPDAGAKVEKRPLGGAQEDAGEDGTNNELESIDQPYKQDNSTDTQLAPAADTVAELPEELKTNLLAIETNLAEPSPTQDEPLNVPEATVGSLDSSVKIPEETLDPNDGAIFDTTEYHKPVAHPAKHGSEWIWIVVIVLIIVICAAGAAAFYLLGTK